MTENSPGEKVPYGMLLLYAIVLVSIWLGCAFLRSVPNALPSKPLILMLDLNLDLMSFASGKRADSFLHVGQSEEDVRAILGEPSGMMTVTNRSILMYNGSFLEFVDGCLVTSDTNLLAEIKASGRLFSGSRQSKNRDGVSVMELTRPPATKRMVR